MTTTGLWEQGHWSAKKCILAALLAALVTVAVATGISIGLAPAHISFSVVYANMTTMPTDGALRRREGTNNGAVPASAAAPPPSAAVGRVEWPDYCRVVVEAKVWFRFAGIPTLLYTITATCFPVNVRAGPVSVNCTS